MLCFERFGRRYDGIQKRRCAEATLMRSWASMAESALGRPGRIQWDPGVKYSSFSFTVHHSSSRIAGA
jgi:hypothetical protein